MKIGDKVKMVNCIEAEENPDKIWTVRSEPWNVCGTMCVLLEGKSGGFAVECLEKIESEGVRSDK